MLIDKYRGVRDRAFEFFTNRGTGAKGSDVDDWFKAERELQASSEADLVEKDGAYDLRVALPGFDGKDVRIAAFGDALVVSAMSTHEHFKADGDVHFCEFGERKLFRRFSHNRQRHPAGDCVQS